MLLRNCLTALLKAIASRIATFRSLIFKPAFNLYNWLNGFGSTQESLDYLASAAPDSYISSATLSSLRKKSRPGRRNHILHEQNIFALLQCQPLSPYIIRHFHDANDAIFVEFVAGGDLGTVLNNKQVKDTSTQRVTQVQKLQSALDYTRWIRQLATAAAWLEQLGLAHCDIRPANMPLSEARNIKLFDFDHACKIRSALASLTEPFARLLGDDGGLDRGTYGIAGSRTEQFAIGSVIYTSQVISFNNTFNTKCFKLPFFQVTGQTCCSA
ncbi:protein kinase domain-containing protein [Metarhizium rileyi]|uniref:Protein kinase domain-containing protein n=1 Tax=Metarhizium rileyi (strain RCEF 4871) TaxID=1649241 RepID=A0A166ZH22_METRR|nr:protein kinase domain-containing protein [Metarhizium rileyi RCEF 4871]